MTDTLTEELARAIEIAVQWGKAEALAEFQHYLSTTETKFFDGVSDDERKWYLAGKEMAVGMCGVAHGIEAEKLPVALLLKSDDLASLTQAILPIITRREEAARSAGAAEMQERCAGVAGAHYSDLGRDAEHHRKNNNEDSLSRCHARMRSASIIEAEIRSLT